MLIFDADIEAAGDLGLLTDFNSDIVDCFSVDAHLIELESLPSGSDN